MNESQNESAYTSYANLLKTSSGNDFGSTTSSPFKMSSCVSRGGEEPSLNEAVTLFSKRDLERVESQHFVQRYHSGKYNALKGTDRQVLPESLKMGRIGHNGLNR